MKKLFFLFSVLIASCLLSCSSKDSISELEAEKLKQENKRIKELQVSQLVNKYTANADWSETIGKKHFYSVELQNLFLRNNERPFLIYAYLDDVFREKDKYYIVLSDWSLGYDKVYYELECDYEFVNNILTSSSNRFIKKYAIIAKINDFKKIRFLVEAVSEGEDAYIDILTSKSILVLGQCLDAICMNE